MHRMRIRVAYLLSHYYRLLLVMVKPRHPSAAATDLARRQRCALALVAAGCLSLFIVTCMTFHSVISDEEYVDDRIAGLGIDGAGAGGDRRERAKGKTPKKRLDGEVDLDDTYPGVRGAHDERFPPDDVERLKAFAQSLRTHDYQVADSSMPYDVNNCPLIPPEGYPRSWPTLDILDNWNPNDTADPHSHVVYQGICRFDAATEHDKALAYREAELPFVIRDDPVVLPTVERWNQPEYLPNILGHQRHFRTDMSSTNQLMFYRTGQNGGGHKTPKDWEEPTKEVPMSYVDWLDKANNPNPRELEPDRPHWYFRLNAKSKVHDRYLFEE